VWAAVTATVRVTATKFERMCLDYTERDYGGQAEIGFPNGDGGGVNKIIILI
jgi:hypothetical protein